MDFCPLYVIFKLQFWLFFMPFSPNFVLLGQFTSNQIFGLISIFFLDFTYTSILSLCKQVSRILSWYYKNSCIVDLSNRGPFLWTTQYLIRWYQTVIETSSIYVLFHSSSHYFRSASYFSVTSFRWLSGSEQLLLKVTES